MSRYGRGASRLLAVTTALWSTLGTSQIVAPPPISFTPVAGQWLGDGPWSVFTIQIGTPPQTIFMLPDSSSPFVLAVNPSGCDSGSGSPCFNERGYLFYSDQSKTWTEDSYRNVSGSGALGLSTAGVFGRDTVALGKGLASVNNQFIGTFNGSTPWLGSFGLFPLAANLSGFNDPVPSFFQGLQNDTHIGSSAWSYTAGCYNRNAPGSVIFGGIDLPKLEAGTTVSTAMSNETGRDLLVHITGISSVDSSQNEMQLLPNNAPIDAFIDTAVSDLWLHPDACDLFVKAFSLNFDPATQSYLIDDDLHQKLSQLSPNITFTLQGSTGASNLTLTYSSFDLHFNKTDNTTQRYFPLKHATHPSQYTLGRAFLQETYLMADYDRRIFNLSQVNFDAASSGPSTILPPSKTNGSSTDPDDGTQSSFVTPIPSGDDAPHGLTPGAIAAIVIVPLAVLSIFLASFLFLRRRKALRAQQAANAKTLSDDPSTDSMELHDMSKQHSISEAASVEVAELSTDPAPVEAGDEERYELDGGWIAPEMSASGSLAAEQFDQRDEKEAFSTLRR